MVMKSYIQLRANHLWGLLGSPGQEILESALKTSLPSTTYNQYKKTLRKNNKDLGIDNTLQENEIDLIIGPPTGRSATIAALAGYPVGTVPLGYATYNGRPFGMAIFAPANCESLILSAMSAWEATFPKRIPPPQLNELITSNTPEFHLISPQQAHSDYPPAH